MRALTINDPAFVGSLAKMAIFNVQEAEYTWQIPNGASTLTAKLWGGAGDGGNYAQGGNGSWVSGRFSVTGGDFVRIRVNYARSMGAFRGGGYSSLSYSGIFMVAGGGGGMGSVYGLGPSAAAGGNAGLSGEAGQNSLGAVGGLGGVTGNGPAGLYLTGENGFFGGGAEEYGGGGGAGFYGGYGGAGGPFEGDGGGGGGGGSSHVSGVSFFVNTGSNFSDPDWNGNAGQAQNTIGQQGSGYVVLRWV